MQQHYDTSSVFVAVIGRPNVGKSSLINKNSNDPRKAGTIRVRERSLLMQLSEANPDKIIVKRPLKVNVLPAGSRLIH